MMKKQSRTILECAIFRHESLEVSKRKSRVWPTFLTSSEVFKNTVCHLTQFYQFEGYYNRVHLRLKMMGEGCDAKKCSFAVSILVLLLLPRCKFHQLQQQRQLATILESCKFPRTIAELLSSLILYSSLLLYAMHFYRNLAYMPKSQRISDNQCTLSTLPLFSRKFKNTNEVICSNKNLRNRRRSQ